MSEATTNRRIQATLRHIVELLARGKYSELESISKSIRLTAEQIESGVTEYGATLAFPPQSCFENLDVVEVAGCPTPTYSIRFRLFTEEEGESDLELEATFIDKNPRSDIMHVEIDNLLVP